MKKLKLKGLIVLGALSMVMGTALGVSLQTEEKYESAEAASGTPSFARFYFCQDTWNNSNNARISKVSLSDNFGASTLFAGTGTTSSYAAISAPSTCYYYIDYSINSNATLYFRFEQNGSNIYPSNHGYSGYIGNNFQPGHIYEIHAGSYSGADGNNKWSSISASLIGYLGTFNVNGGTRNSQEKFDYKEFRYSSTLMKAPTRSGYTFNGWLCSVNGFVNRAETTYGSSAPFEMTAQWVCNTQRVIGANYARIWVGYNGNSSQLWYKDKRNVKIKINNYSYSITGTYYNDSESIDGLSDCPRRYDYFDVPYSCFEGNYTVNFERYNGNTWETTSKFYAILNNNFIDNNNFNILYCPSNWETGVVNIGGLTSSDSLFATLALCGVQTCNSNKINGYNGYSNWYSTFGKSSSIINGMSAYTITDFASKSAYTSDTEINKSVNAYDKYLWVKYKATGGDEPSPASLISGKVISDNSSAAVIAIICSVSIVALGGFFFLRKRKHI